MSLKVERGVDAVYSNDSLLFTNCCLEKKKAKTSQKLHDAALYNVRNIDVVFAAKIII